MFLKKKRWQWWILLAVIFTFIKCSIFAQEMSNDDEWLNQPPPVIKKAKSAVTKYKEPIQIPSSSISSFEVRKNSLEPEEDHKTVFRTSNRDNTNPAKSNNFAKTKNQQKINKEANITKNTELTNKKEFIEADASFYNNHKTYIVQPGDTLGKIAKKLLGSSAKWREIAKANPNINPNKLTAGITLIIPSDQPNISSAETSSYDLERDNLPSTSGKVITQKSNQAKVRYNYSYDSNSFDAPTYEPPPVITPPPATPNQQSIQPSTSLSNLTNQPLSSTVSPPPPPYLSAPSIQPAPITIPPAPAPVTSPTPVPAPAPVTSSLYREEKYRIPDELKPTDYSPYFANFNGAHGFFETESALIPYRKTWHLGFHYRYDNYKYLNGKENVIDGNQSIAPVNLLYTGKKIWSSLSVPYQSWEVRSANNPSPTVKLEGLYDTELKLGYQIWKNYEGTHAITLHVGGKFPSNNYHQPIVNLSGKTRVNSRIGPAGATRGSWVEFGGAYSGKLNDRWSSHINLAIANDPEDSIVRYIYRTSVDYRVNQHFALAMEINGSTWEMDNGPDGPNIDLTIGMMFFNEKWQGVIGFPISLQSEFNYGHDYGVVAGLNTRWD